MGAWSSDQCQLPPRCAAIKQILRC
uniref:Uncharacterized protein n=1 Tax=Arundo donax TaxID=35708 RepID=A0A0A8YPJ6_ARUDO